MNKEDIIIFLERYKKSWHILDKHSLIENIESIIFFMKYEKDIKLPKDKMIEHLKLMKKVMVLLKEYYDAEYFENIILYIKKMLNDENVFNIIIASNKTADLMKYNINQKIVNNVDNLSLFLRTLERNELKKWRLLDLNILRFLLNRNHCNYEKNKKEIIKDIEYYTRERLNSENLKQMII